MGRVRIKGMALPTEHGGWGFVLEPVLLSLLSAPSVGGASLSFAAVSFFLVRQPLRILLSREEPVWSSSRRRWALFFASLYLGFAVAGIVTCVSLCGLAPVWALVLSSPLVLLFFFYDRRGRSRNLIAELAGPLGLAGSAPAVALAAGWDPVDAAVLWILAAARVVPSILYVRARLRLGRGERVNRRNVVVWHCVFLGVAVALALGGFAPLTAVAAIATLLARAAWGLSGRPGVSPATRIGLVEILYGVFYVLLIAGGYRRGL